jgi:hypothetical protein
MFKDRCISSADFDIVLDQNWAGKECFCPSEIEKVVEQLILRFIDQLYLHHSEEAKGIMEELRIEWVLNASYSPEFNPIEFVFSQVKRNYR